MENDLQVYYTYVSMNSNSSITTDLNLPPGDLYDCYFKVTKCITKGYSDNVVHLHSLTLSSPKSYNNTNYSTNLISGYAIGTTTQMFIDPILETSYSLPLPTNLNNNNNIDFYLSDKSFNLSNIQNMEFEICVYRKENKI
jgi:hypothetical protein